MPDSSDPGRGPPPCQTGGIPDDKALTQALDGLEDEVPDRVARAIRLLRDPTKKTIRMIAGALFVLGGFLWFLPVLGLEMLPIGLLLLAMDMPFLRGPVGRGTLWLECQWNSLRRRWLA